MEWIDFFILMKQELAIAAILFILLIMKVSGDEPNAAGLEASNHKFLQLVNLLLALNVAAGFFGVQEGSLFANMFHTSSLLAVEKTILSAGTLIVSLQSYCWLKSHKHVHEFYILLLSTLLGMDLMISSGNMLMFYLGLELSTIPLAALANFDLEKRKSSEAAMKLIMSSAFSSGLLLFGVSLLYGTTGTLSFTEIPAALNGSELQLFSFVLILAGFAFKISAVPFHLWTADVYQGAPVAVTAYLSVISKAAVLFIFLTVLYQVFQPLANAWYNMLFVISVLTMLVGNLFAIRQQNLKRFFAFSSIAQVGFILVGISASSVQGSAAVIYFTIVYIFSNLGAFGVVALVSSLAGKENIDDLKGFYQNNKMLSWVLAISLFALAGIPPTAGFFGKFFLLMAGAAKGNYVLLIIAALNMVISLYYYLRIIKAVFMDANETPIQKLTIPALPKLALWICLIGVVVTGLLSVVYDYIYQLALG
ncbi:MAG: hypothetical protein RLY16_2151 [Bacteroidota bacterium]|jgi:NADH-quinone oxidoreductase subunit N